VIYFKVQLGEQEMSNLTYLLPKESFLLIKPEESSDQYYGLLEDSWYNEMIRNLPRQTLNSLEVISQGEMSMFMHETEKQAGQRRFAGDVNLFRLLS
jgi:hypothetical protein